MRYSDRRTPARRLVFAIASIYPLCLLALSAMHALQPRRTGLLGLSEVFAPYLFLPLLVLLPFAFMRGAALLRVMLVVCAVVYGVRFPPNLISASPAETPGAIQLSVMSWNVMVGDDYDEVARVLSERPAAIVGLVEADWHRLANDPEVAKVYPYRWGVQAGGTVTGQALLSVYPIIQQGIIDMPAEVWSGIPRAAWARLDVGLGRNVVVVVAHPPPARMCTRQTFPTNCYDTSTRDKQIAAINAFVQPYLQAWDAVLLMGDFNVTEREPAYNDLSAGLTDAHIAAGSGVGATWRPAQMMGQPFGLLRIDYIFSSLNLMPLTLDVDCTPHGSDHCIVLGTFEVMTVEVK
ncbi:MAG: endonuclease/exonuclease/phosphatase family protein [Chloroflexia bacterium]